MKFSPKFFYFPYLTGASCVVSEDCPSLPFPTTGPECSCGTVAGGVNEYYVIPCDEEFTEANVTSPAWYQGLIDANRLGRSGAVLGSITKLSDKKERVSSCRTEQLISVTWALKVVKKCFDKTVARATVAQMNALILNSNRFLLIARMCDGDEQILPIGTFNTNDFNWTVPDNFEELRYLN